MGLQIRLHHSLGERVIDLPERTVEQPIIVGRAETADVQVPTYSANDEHCALFIHQGRWFAQDMGASGETLVNGYSAHEPTALQIGDVISIGADAEAPTIEVEPAAAAAGKTGYVVSAAARRAAAAAAQRRVAGGHAGQSRRPAAAHQAAATQQAYYEPEQQNGDDVGGADWPTEDAGGQYAGYSVPAASYSTPTRRRPAKQSNAKPIAITIGVFVLVIGGVGIYAWKASRPPPPPPPEKQEAKPKPTAPKSNNIFGL